MTNNKNIYSITGTISEILGSNRALISFRDEGEKQNALAQKNKFYYNGRVIPKNEDWDNYISIGMPVKFNAYSKKCEKYSGCNWHVTIFWPIECNLFNKISMQVGLMNVVGRIIDIDGNEGILETFNATENSHMRILFTAKNVYIDESRFIGKHLREVLDIDENVSVDAIPYISNENDKACEWFATIVYKGKRPSLIHNILNDNNNETSHSNDGIYKFWTSAYNSSIVKDYLSDFHSSFLNEDFETQRFNFIHQHISNPQTLFVSGEGIIIDILNDEFGIILGEFRKNLFQKIIFHRQNVFLYKIRLESANLSKILCSGDGVQFIAVGAPFGFLTDWIAVQISVFGKELQEIPSS